MRWSVTNPRVILLGVGGVFIVAALIGAYLDRPRVEVEFGTLAETIPLRQSQFDVDVRSADFQDEFRKILGSSQFMEQLRVTDPGMEAIFAEKAAAVTEFPVPSPTASAPNREMVSQWSRTLSKAENSSRIILMISNSEERDTGVVYMLFRQYGVSRPSPRWLERLQSWLPDMPDHEALAARAKTANQAAKNALKKQIETAAQQAAAICRKGKATAN
jgi:hypothetical protein